MTNRSDLCGCGPLGIGFAAGEIVVYGLGYLELAVTDPETGRLDRIADTSMGVFTLIGDNTGFWAVVTREGRILRFDVTVAGVDQ